jgi:hypothetical protein
LSSFETEELKEFLRVSQRYSPFMIVIVDIERIFEVDPTTTREGEIREMSRHDKGIS